MNAIDIQQLSYRYPDGTIALHNISLQVKENKKLAILGANGSGKTTLMMHLNGLNLAQSGSVKIMGEQINPKNLRNVRQKVGVLFDNPDNQLFSTTVFEDIAFGPFNMGCSDEDIRLRTNAAIEQVGIRHLAEKPPHNLSLGQKKKAAIAGLLSMDLQLFIMDEPFSGLDPVSVDEFLDILNTLHQGGRTLVMSTHDVDLAYGWADEVAVISNGELAAFGGTEVLENAALCHQWRLRVPLLYEVFCKTQVRPKNAADAKACLKSLAGVHME